MNIERGQAKRLLQELKHGTLSGHPRIAKELRVGRDFWIEGIRGELEDAKEYGTSAVRVVIGSYGDGKSHFLQTVLGEALERGFWCSYASLERDAALKKLEVEVLWKQFARKLYVPGQAETVDLARALEEVMRERSLDAVRDALAGGVEPDLEKGVRGYLERRASGLDATEYRHWLLGEPVKPRGLARKIDGVSAMPMLSSLVGFLRRLGYAGIVIAMDEMELAKDGAAGQRKRFYESVRQLVDRQIPGYVVYGAATPDMLVDSRGFQEHQPLWDRLRVYAEQSAKEKPSARQPLVYLEATPLRLEDFVEIGRKIRHVHGRAEGWDAEAAYPDLVLERMAELVEGSRSDIGKPRWFVTSVVRDLDRKLADPGFNPLADIRRRLGEVAEHVREAEARRHE